MPSISTQPNRAYQNIPDVGEDSATQRAAIQTISDALKTHERRDSNYLKSFIRFEELVDLEIIDAQGNSLLDLSGGGSGGATELNDLTDVNITSLVDNRILGYDFASSMWTSQSAGDLNLSEIGHTHVLADITDFTGIDLGDLGDVDTVGASDFDLLFRIGAIWEPTDGLLQWSGSDLHIAAGDINFYAVGDAVQHSIRQNFPFSGDMTIQVVAGDLVLQPGDDVKLDADTNLQLEHGRQIRWLDNIDVPTPLLEFDSDAGGGLAVDIEMVSAIAEVTTASTSYVDLAGMVVDQNNLQTGDDYLIIVNANIRNFLSTAVNDNFVRIVNESETMFSGSEYRFESTSSNNVSGKRYGYVNWFTANAGVGDDDIQFQGQASAASPNLAVNGFRATLLNLTTLGSNHVKARDVSVTNIPASAAWTTVETVELTEPGDWIIFACVQCSGFNGNSDQRTRLHDGTNTITESTHDIEDSIGTKVHNFQGVIENAVGNETISLQMTNGGGGVTWNAVFKSIVAIRLDAFADYAVKRLADAPDPPDGNELTLDTLSFTAGETKGYVFFGALEEDWTASGASGGTELQVQVNGGGYTTISGGLTAEFEDLGSQDISQKLLHPNSAVFLSAGNSVDVRMRHDPAASPTNNDIFRTEIVAIALETAPTEQIFFVGNVSYPVHLQGTLFNIDNAIGIGWDNVAGDHVEHLIFESVAVITNPSDLIVQLDFEDGSEGGTSATNTGSTADPVFTINGSTTAAAAFSSSFGADIQGGGGSTAPMTIGDNGLTDPFGMASNDYTIHFRYQALESAGDAYPLEAFCATIFQWKFQWIGGTLRFEASTGTDLLSAGGLSLSTWYHVAFTKAGNTGYLFIDGILIDSADLSSAVWGAEATTELRAGRFHDEYIDNLVLVKNQALWTSNFTPPADADTEEFEAFLVGDPAYNTIIDGLTTTVTGDFVVDGVSTFNDDVEVVGLMEADRVIAGDPGTEGSGITVGGVLYESAMKVSDIGGTNIAQMILHRHSTTLPSLLIGARAKNDTSAHTIVANNDVLLTIIAAGWNGGDSYSSSSQINFEVDGTPGNDDMPGQITFLTTPDGTEVPVERMRIRATGNVEIDNDLIIAETAQINMGTLVGDKIILFSGDYKIGIEANTQYYTSNQLFRWYEDNADGGTSDAMELNAQSGNLTIGGSLIVGGLVDGVDVAAHAADATIHFTEASIDHTAILNIGTNTHAQIDTHIADATIHGNVSNTGTPLNNQLAVWTDATTIEGVSSLTFNGSQFFVSSAMEISGTLNIDGLWYLQQMSNAGADVATYGQIWIDGDDDRVKFTPDTGVDNTLAYLSEVPGAAITQLTGDVTAGPGSGSQVATIPADTVTNAQLANMVNNTIKGRTTAGTGDPQDILLAANTVLGVFGGVLQGQQVQTLQIQDLAVTYAKMQNVSTGDRLLGRQSGGFGNVQEITLGTNLSLTGTTLNAATGAVAFDDLTAKTSGTGNYQTSGDFIADNFEATGLGPLTTPGTDDAYVGGYGLMGDRVQPIYISNASGPVQINASGVHGAAARVAEFGATTIEFDANLYMEGGHVFRIYDAADQDFIEIRHLGTSIEISAAGTGGGAEDIRISAGNSNAVILEYNTVDVFESQNHLLLGNTTGALVRHHDGSYYDVGMNVTPLAVEDNNLTLAAQHAGQYSYYDDGSNYNVATPASTDLDFPVGARFDMINRTGGVISITVGTGITLYWADGTGATFATGQRSLSYGWATLIRHTASVFIVTGNGLS